MRLAISNIAWDVAEDDAVAPLLQRHRVDAIDIAHSKYFPKPAEAGREQVLALKRWWAARGIEISGMQALLFGTSGLNVFGTPETQAAMLAHLQAVCRIGAILGAPRLVFGSPKSRDRSGLEDARALDMAVAFFRRLGELAAAEGVVICLEPNPPGYGANFMTTSAETAGVVAAVAHPSIRMQLDAGAMTINGESPAAVLREHAGLIGHIHASEPDLLPLGDGGTPHDQVAAALAEYLPGRLVSIEMLATQHEPHLVAIERALQVADRSYRSVPEGAAP